MDVNIRDEAAADIDAIRQTTINAFASSELGHHGEADLVSRLRANSTRFISLVAELETVIVGHILFTPVIIHGEASQVEGLGLAPISVLPAYQRRGVGSQLVKTSLDRLDDAGCRFVVVMGHPGFYERFGFEPSSRIGVESEFDDVPEEVFRIRVLSPASAIPRGVARYRPEFSQ